MGESIEETELFKSILGNPSAFIVDQQKDAPELSEDQRHKILADLYKSKKLIFLVRYNKFLTKEQLEFIRNTSSMDDEVLYFLDKLIPSKNINQIKQRRFAALQALIADGDYFNDNNMRERNPYLYEQMIGRYLSNQERSKIEDQDRDFCDVQRPLSTFLLRQMDKNRIEESRIEQRYMDGGQYDEQSNDNGFLERIQKYNRQEDGEEEEEEVEEEEEDDDDDKIEEANNNTKNGKLEAIRAADQEHKQYLRKEFTNIMYENFLAGRDSSFDYKTVDDDDKYDPINLMDRDAEESYFDSEEPD